MRLGAQVYSVRNQIKTPEGYLATMWELKSQGYDTVQHAGAPLGDAYLLRDLSQQAGMKQICPNIDGKALLEDVDQVIEDLQILGCDSIMLPYITPDDFAALESFRKAWEPYEKPILQLQEAGIKPAYHNHDFDIAPMSDWDGAFVDWLLENRPGWEFILDVCWAQYAQVDVCAYLEKLGSRLNCVHFKDYTGSINSKHVPVFCACGKGVVNMAAYSKKIQALGIEDVIVEQDNALHYPEPMGQMEQSAAYVKSLF